MVTSVSQLLVRLIKDHPWNEDQDPESESRTQRDQHLEPLCLLTHLWRQICSLIGWPELLPSPVPGQILGDRLAAVLDGSPTVARLRPQVKVEEEEDGPCDRGDEAAITEVPQCHTGHGGRASIALHYTVAEREKEQGHRSTQAHTSSSMLQFSRGRRRVSPGHANKVLAARLMPCGQEVLSECHILMNNKVFES